MKRDILLKGVKQYLSKSKISDIKKRGEHKISEELDIKLDQVSKYLIKAKNIFEK